MRMKGHGGSFREHFMQQSGSDTQGHRNKNIFYKVASEEWELGMCVVWPGRWVHGLDTLVLAPQGAGPAGMVYPQPLLMPFLSFLKELNVYFFSFPSLFTLGPDVPANPWGMHIVAGHRLLLLS